MTVSTSEEITMLERNAAMARADGQNEIASDYQAQADILREQQILYGQLSAELLDAAKDKDQAYQLASTLDHYSGIQHLERLMAALYARGLIDAVKFNSIQQRMSAPTATQRRLYDAHEYDRIKLDKLYQRVMRAASDPNKARELYNQLSGPRDEEKIKEWIRRCGENGVLPLAVTVVLRYSDWLSNLILPGEGSEANKARDLANKENK